VAAREHFDRAVEILLKQPEGTHGDPHLQAAFNRLIDRITALDVLALRDADGITEARSAPAAIDEVLNASLVEPAAPKATTAEIVALDLEQLPRDVPIAQNAKVLSYVELFQGRLGSSFRAASMQPAVLRDPGRLQDEGIPLDLAYIPMVESAFKSNALSRAAHAACGSSLGTAQEHGLDQDWFIDERADPEKATRGRAVSEDAERHVRW
jgi:membrane-bound lytic murein transglycosylase D